MLCLYNNNFSCMYLKIQDTHTCSLNKNTLHTKYRYLVLLYWNHSADQYVHSQENLNMDAEQSVVESETLKYFCFLRDYCWRAPLPTYAPHHVKLHLSRHCNGSAPCSLKLFMSKTDVNASTIYSWCLLLISGTCSQKNIIEFNRS